jgi:hypothetical protein
MTENTDDTIQNRSEIAFVIDAKDTNPNGDPLTADNEPRIDPVTGQCVVTDVRLKRYLRDQLVEDGHTVLISNPNHDVLTREEMYDAVEEEMDVSTEDAEPEELLKAFVETAADVRYFGATISLDTELADDLPDQFEGPVQFNHGRSYHEVARIGVASDLPEDEIRGTDDFHLDVSELVTALADNEARIDTVHVTADSAVDFMLPDGETGDREAFYAALKDALGTEAVEPTTCTSGTRTDTVASPLHI